MGSGSQASMHFVFCDYSIRSKENDDLIKSRNLSYEYNKEYDDGVSYAGKALDDITFDIHEGEFISIVGRNGSGKSTLARQLNALIAPTGGSLWVNGLDTSDDDNILDIRQSTGMVFQNPDNQIVANMVEDDVGFGPENIGVPTEEIWQRVEECLRTVNMIKRRKTSPNHLSGGQKQRVAIAGVLAMRPKCVVLDEPTAMLDPVGRREILEAVTKLNKENGINIVLITHYMEETTGSDRIFVMDNGRLVMTGTPREVFSNAEELAGYGLELPISAEIAHILINKGIGLPNGILTENELVNEVIRAAKQERKVCR